MGHALAAHPDHLPMLRARRDAHLRFRALDRRHVDLVAERRLRRRETCEVHEIVAFATEEVVLLQADEDVEVAGRSAAHARLALAGDAELLAVVDAGRDGQSDLAVLALTAFASAVSALLIDGLPGAAAARAGGDVHEAAEHRL